MAKEGWEQGLGHHSKIEWDRGWHTNKVKNGEVHAEKKKFNIVDTNPGATGKVIEPGDYTKEG